MKKDFTEKILFGVFAIVGAVFLIVAIAMVCVQIQFKQNADPVTAVIDRIETHRDSDGDYSHSVYVSYEYQGEYFKGVHLNYYSGDMYEGKQIELLCDRNNPHKVRSKGGELLLVAIFGGMGLVFFLIGGIPLISLIKKDKMRKQLLQTGKPLYAKVESIGYNATLTVNGRHPFVIYCLYEDPYGDVTYRFKSQNLWSDPSPQFPIGSEIKVFVDGNDYSRYCVCVDEASPSSSNRKIVDYT